MSSAGVIVTIRDAFTTVWGPKFWRRLRSVLIALVVFAGLRSCVADWSEVPSASMFPTIMAGDRVIVNKLAYDLKLPFTMLHLLRWSPPRRGEIVVFFSPANGLRLVKRVIAVPGDTIEMRNNVLWLNGQPASYSNVPAIWLTPQHYTRETASAQGHWIATAPAGSARQSFAPVKIASGKYFLMGDNRDDSIDSRVFGPVDRDAIIGRVSLVFWSLDPERFLHVRWGRTLTRLDR